MFRKFGELGEFGKFGEFRKFGVPEKPSSKIRRVMKSNNYGLHDGCIYKKLEECEYTYIYCTGVKNNLLNLLGNFKIADIITPHITQLRNLLSESACRLLEPIKIDFKFVEVSDGFCSDIEGKKFNKNPKRLIGSPRAYVRYTYYEDKIPNPKPFIDGMDKHNF